MISELRVSKGILALSALLLAPAEAHAADAANSGKGRYTKQEVDVQAKQTNLTKPEAPPPPKKEKGPVLTVDQFVQQKREGIIKLVELQIGKMKRLIQVTGDDDPQKPDFLFRLGESMGPVLRVLTTHGRVDRLLDHLLQTLDEMIRLGRAHRMRA